MTLQGNNDHEDLLWRSAMAQAKATDATRLSPELRHRQHGWWPSAGTVVRIALVVLVAIVMLGWVLTALNN